MKVIDPESSSLLFVPPRIRAFLKNPGIEEDGKAQPNNLPRDVSFKLAGHTQVSNISW